MRELLLSDQLLHRRRRHRARDLWKTADLGFGERPWQPGGRAQTRRGACGGEPHVGHHASPGALSVTSQRLSTVAASALRQAHWAGQDGVAPRTGEAGRTWFEGSNRYGTEGRHVPLSPLPASHRRARRGLREGPQAPDPGRGGRGREAHRAAPRGPGRAGHGPPHRHTPVTPPCDRCVSSRHDKCYGEAGGAGVTADGARGGPRGREAHSGDRGGPGHGCGRVCGRPGWIGGRGRCLETPHGDGVHGEDEVPALRTHSPTWTRLLLPPPSRGDAGQTPG